MTITTAKADKPATPQRARASAAQGLFTGQSTTGPGSQGPEPDLVTAIFDLLCETHPAVAEERAQMEAAVRHQFKGLRGTVTDKPDSATLARRALALFNGRNAREVARRLSISRPHVYRLLKQSGKN